MKKITLSFIFFFVICTLKTFGQSTATYTIVFESFWESVADNPTEGQSTINLPGGAHWSDLVGATHATEHTFLMMDGMASPGVELIAELGVSSTFKNEVNSNSDANQFIDGDDLRTARGTITISNLAVNDNFPLVTLASMIAPSPDWFIAVNSINLRSGNASINNGWKATFSIDLFPYDAGTEEGNTYTLSNSATNPQETISSLVNVSPFNDKRIGVLTFNYISSTLSTETLETLENIKIYPNPAQDFIAITNTQNVNLKQIEIYSILGHQVLKKEITNASKTHQIDVSGFSKGIYLLKLVSNRSNYTQKLIIK